MNEGFAMGMTMRHPFAFALGSVRWRDKSRLRGPFLSHGSVKDAAALEIFWKRSRHR
jgi:DNA-binding transcriptional regulator WhiA